MDTSYQKLIHDYLEGTLSENEERQLFDNLSANPEWREELAFQMRMHEAMQKDLSTVTIPSKSTASIFAALGFGVPEKTTAALIFRFLPHLKLSTVLLSLSATALATSAIYFLTLRDPHIPKIPDAITRPVEISNPPVPQVSEPVTEPTVTASPDSKEVPHAEETKPVHKASMNIGKFSSVDYLTNEKIVGISSGGTIYMSDDGGTLWKNLPSHTSKDLFGLHFRDTSNGLVVGAEGTILLTADAGKNWASVSSGTESNLIAVRYATADTVYACGAQGTILRSTSGGLVWKKLESGTFASLFNIHFENAQKGSIGGEHGIMLQTTDGGLTWTEKK